MITSGSLYSERQDIQHGDSYQAALYVATANPPRLTTRNKHWNIKHHWFRSHLGEGKDCIKILPIPTQDQRADIFTKALTKALFATFRKLLMGW